MYKEEQYNLREEAGPWERDWSRKKENLKIMVKITLAGTFASGVKKGSFKCYSVTEMVMTLSSK